LQVIRRGIELGFAIKQITPNDFDRDWVVASDFLIFNNFYSFEPKLYHFLLKAIWEYKKPYVVYSHDHRDVIGEETARIRFARAWFSHAFFNVFISPMHRDNFLTYLGEGIKPLYVLTPPVDTDFFYKRANVERRPRTAVNLTGRLVSSKGLMNIYKWAIANSNYKLSVYSKYADGTSGKLLSCRPNVKILGNVPYKMLPDIYSEHQYVIHLPVYPEAAGRTIIEGALCGCKPIANEIVGVMSFSEEELPLSDPRKLKQIIETNVYTFWYNIIRYYQKTKYTRAKEW